MRQNLESLAKGNENRELVLKRRRERQVSRSRVVTCPTCLSRVYDRRHKDDVCAPCLSDMWAGQDLLKQGRDLDEGIGVINCVMTMTPHWLPHPPIHYSRDRPISETAGFARKRTVFDREEVVDASDTMQRLFVEIFSAIAAISPGDPDAPAKGVLIGRTSGDNAWARMPPALERALEHLWHLIIWQDAVAFELGLEKGQRLLTQLALGELAEGEFSDAIAKQVKAAREQREHEEEGRVRI